MREPARFLSVTVFVAWMRIALQTITTWLDTFWSSFSTVLGAMVFIAMMMWLLFSFIHWLRHRASKGAGFTEGLDEAMRDFAGEGGSNPLYIVAIVVLSQVVAGAVHALIHEYFLAQQVFINVAITFTGLLVFGVAFIMLRGQWLQPVDEKQRVENTSSNG